MGGIEIPYRKKATGESISDSLSDLIALVRCVFSAHEVVWKKLSINYHPICCNHGTCRYPSSDLHLSIPWVLPVVTKEISIV